MKRGSYLSSNLRDLACRIRRLQAQSELEVSLLNLKGRSSVMELDYYGRNHAIAPAMIFTVSIGDVATVRSPSVSGGRPFRSEFEVEDEVQSAL
ncbi:uncharacterized protein J3R85_015967 [Psidium guajava]|nr:uncharacterized protein J3R85_015967 [Psidium guajava]